MKPEQRIERLERQQQRLVACVMTMAGVVLELAVRELGGPGPGAMTGDEVASSGLQMLARGAICRTGAEAIERVVQVLRLLVEEPERGQEDTTQGSRVDKLEIPEHLRPSRPTEESDDD